MSFSLFNLNYFFYRQMREFEYFKWDVSFCCSCSVSLYAVCVTLKFGIQLPHNIAIIFSLFVQMHLFLYEILYNLLHYFYVSFSSIHLYLVGIEKLPWKKRTHSYKKYRAGRCRLKSVRKMLSTSQSQC